MRPPGYVNRPMPIGLPPGGDRLTETTSNAGAGAVCCARARNAAARARGTARLERTLGRRADVGIGLESGAGFHSGPLGAVARLWREHPKQSQVSFAPARREKRRYKRSWRVDLRASRLAF